MTDALGKDNTEVSNIKLDDAFELVKEEVNRALSASPLIIRRFTEHLAGAEGKYIRAMSLLACAQNKDGLISESAVSLAASIEILHLATLVHDDVIDDADMRRGIPTLKERFGNKTAVICGDYLLSVALRMAHSIRNKQDYLDLNMPNYVVKICSGELFQHTNNGNYSLSVYQYMKIISGKTAALFEAAFYAGAIMSRCDKSELKLYRKMGRCLGMIFQLIDDCMDFEATEGVALKPVQSDFEKDVITLPIIHAFSKRKNLVNKASKREMTRDELNEAVTETNGLDYTRKIAKKYYNKYKAILNRLDITEDKRIDLTSILDKAFRVF